MNNRSFYMIISVLCLIDLVLLMRSNPDVTAVLRTMICGGALYYVVKRFRQPSVTMFLFLAVAVLYNPIVRIHMDQVWWLVSDVVTLALFYFLAKVTPIHETGIKHYAEDDEAGK